MRSALDEIVGADQHGHQIRFPLDRFRDLVVEHIGDPAAAHGEVRVEQGLVARARVGEEHREPVGPATELAVFLPDESQSPSVSESPRAT